MNVKTTRFAWILAAGLAVAPAAAQQSQPAPAAPAPQAAPAAPAAFDPSRSDEKAIAIVDKVMKAMGAEAFAKAPFIKFTWYVKQGENRRNVRTHYWDKFGQRSRMEGPSSDGQLVVATVNFATREGVAAKGGQVQSDAELKKYVDIAYGALINDSYWLFMQFKLKDPGVRLRYEGELPAGPVTYDKILVSFDDGIGRTSKDRYWIYVNRANNRIERWSYVLQGQQANSSPVAWEWTDWADVKGMQLSMRKTQPGGEAEIVLENVEVLDSLPETAFTIVDPIAPAAGAAPQTAPAGGQ